MLVMNCPNCGMQAQVPQGVPNYLCTYCHRTFNVGGQAAPVVVVRPVTYTSGWSLYWTIRLGILAVVALISLGGWVYYKVTGHKNAAMAALDDDDDDDDWTGSKPLSCSGNDVYTVSGVKATFTSGTAIDASGNCKVTCKNCTLKAPTAVQAGGNAQVTLVGGSVDGDTSIVASGNGKVDVQGATVTGKTDKSGNGAITGLPAAPASAASSAHVAAATPAPSAAPHASPKPAGKKK
jgi:hypothetical protein